MSAKKRTKCVFQFRPTRRKRRKAAEGLNNHRGHLPPCCWLMSKFQSAKSPDQDKCLCTSSTFSTTPQRAHRTKMKAAQSQSGLFAL